MMEIHEKIRFIRKLRGWSQEEIAARLDMSPNGYGSIERGDTDVNLSRLKKIGELFEMTLPELVSFNSKKLANSANDKTNDPSATHESERDDTHANLQFELEKQKLMLEISNQKITTQAFEIEKLTKIIALMKAEMSTLKGEH